MQKTFKNMQTRVMYLAMVRDVKIHFILCKQKYFCYSANGVFSSSYWMILCVNFRCFRFFFNALLDIFLYQFFCFRFLFYLNVSLLSQWVLRSKVRTSNEVGAKNNNEMFLYIFCYTPQRLDTISSVRRGFQLEIKVL